MCIRDRYDWVSIADLGTYQKYVDETKEKISALAVQESGIKSVPANTVITVSYTHLDVYKRQPGNP